MIEELILAESRNGKSVFANREFKKGEKIMDFKGPQCTYEQLPYPYMEDKHVQIGKNRYMGPSGGLDDFVNHSCDPNSGLIIEKEVTLIAIKDIKKGEEITWDYSTTMAEEDWGMDCNCGSKKCRKRIMDFYYLPEETKRKYEMLGIVPDYVLKP